MLMSQCYSGSFTNAATRDAAGLPAGNVCGYFSTTAERPAYGCYPEVRDKDNLGHSFDFIQELAQAGSFRNAHLRVLEHDATPDAPLRTSDAFLEELLQKKAVARGVGYDTFVDVLLARAWKRKGAWEPEIRLLDAIGRSFGSFSPRSLAEIREQAARLSEVSEQLDTHAKAWKVSLGDANRANLDRFLAKQPAWAEQVSDAALASRGRLGSRAGRQRSSATWRISPAATGRWRSGSARCRGKADAGAGAGVSDGGARGGRPAHAHDPGHDRRARVPLARGPGEERAAYEALLGCESLSLPLARPVHGHAAGRTRPAFPPSRGRPRWRRARCCPRGWGSASARRRRRCARRTS